MNREFAINLQTPEYQLIPAYLHRTSYPRSLMDVIAAVQSWEPVLRAPDVKHFIKLLERELHGRY